jgi:hypothetical protein
MTVTDAQYLTVGRQLMDVIDDLKEGSYAEMKRRTEDRKK